MRRPIPPLSSPYFLAKVLAKTGTGSAATYTFSEQWYDGTAVGVKAGGRYGDATNPAVSVGAEMAVGDLFQCRSADAVGGLSWEAVPLASTGDIGASRGELSDVHAMTTDDAWEALDCSVSLPEAGTYLLFGGVTGQGSASAISVSLPPVVKARLHDGTAAVESSDVVVMSAQKTAVAIYGTGAMVAGPYTAAGPVTISVQVYRYSGTWSAVNIEPESADFGGTWVGYVKLSDTPGGSTGPAGPAGATGATGPAGADGSVASVGITPPAAGITVSGSPVTTSGSITLALADDLAALEALSGTDTIYYRSGANTWSSVTVGTGLSFSGGTLSASGGGGSPGGSSGNVQTNDGSGGFAGSASLNWNGSLLSVSGDVSAGIVTHTSTPAFLTTAAGTLGTVIGYVQINSSNGGPSGYLPIYDSIT